LDPSAELIELRVFNVKAKKEFIKRFRGLANNAPALFTLEELLKEELFEVAGICEEPTSTRRMEYGFAVKDVWKEAYTKAGGETI
jgi:hypothetical protein